MTFKDGVDIRGVSPELVLGLVAADSVYSEHAIPMVVTSVLDSKHGDRSLHYKGKAVDLRLPSRYDQRPGLDNLIRAELKLSLGSQWDVVLESDHLHVEFDPK